jgi:uncharacterized membrane protein YfcA
MLLTLLLGTAIGCLLGLTGAGGGILAVPALVLGLGFSLTDATPVSLLAVGAAALLGSLDGLRKGIVRYKAALLMAAAGALLTPLGIWIAHNAPNRWLMNVFALVMLIAAVRMLAQSRNSVGESGALAKQHTQALSVRHKNCMLDPATGKLKWDLRCTLTLAGIGSCAGLLTGMLGVGGGFLIVPAFRRFSNVGMHGIVATSLMVIALVSGSAVIGMLIHGVRIGTGGWIFVMAALAGMLLGRVLMPLIPARLLQRIFALVVFAVALFLLIRTNLPFILPAA